MDCNYDRGEIWNSVRKILKDNGWSKYYDHIPSILDKIGYEYKIICPSAFAVDEILNDFKKLSHGVSFDEGEARNEKTLTCVS